MNKIIKKKGLKCNFLVNLICNCLYLESNDVCTNNSKL